MYYNDNDAYCAEWLKYLTAFGQLPAGKIDERKIQDVEPKDLEGHGQCHFFAGIGGWPLALRLAGWPEDREVWTGSCPCQPFSSAGKRKGVEDERHVWPHWLPLIRERLPSVLFGEQVASPLGRGWLAGVQADLEALGYAFGAADLCAAGVGAPHIRQRLWWVANIERNTGEQRRATAQSREGAGTSPEGAHAEPGRCSDVSGMGNSDEARPQRWSEHAGECANQRSPWEASELIPCDDGKARRIESGTFPLAHGVPARVGKLRAYGNAIVPQVAAEFVRAFMEAIE